MRIADVMTLYLSTNLANAHRVFVTEESPMSSSPTLSSAAATNLCGIVSVVDGASSPCLRSSSASR